jgi:hypothetical protein
MSLISAITARGHMRFMIKEKGGVNAAVFIEFLRRLVAGAKRAIFLIVDRGPAHIAKKTRAFVDSPIKGARRRSGNCARKAAELTPGDLLCVASATGAAERRPDRRAEVSRGRIRSCRRQG